MRLSWGLVGGVRGRKTCFSAGYTYLYVHYFGMFARGPYSLVYDLLCQDIAWLGGRDEVVMGFVGEVSRRKRGIRCGARALGGY